MSIEGEFERCWPWLAAAAARGRERGIGRDELLALLRSGHAQLWPGDTAALVTECVATDEGRFVHAWLGGGALDGLLALRPGVEAWGRAMGCDFASIDGRSGWDRVFRRLGYARSNADLRRRL